MDVPLSNKTIVSALGSVNDNVIVKYSDLDEFKSLNDLMNGNNYVIILIESQKNSGHWVALYKKDNNTYYYFNSYGKKYDDDISTICAMSDLILGNERNSIRNLAQKSNADIVYNKVRYQNNTSTTCGRWCLLAITMFNMNYNMKQLQNFFKNSVKDYKDYYEMILDLTSNVRQVD